MSNVCIIVCDALRARNLPEWGYPLMTAPTISSLCDVSLVYRNAYSQCNYTTPSVMSMLTGKYPYEHGISQLMVPEWESLQSPTIFQKWKDTHKSIMVNDLLPDLFDMEGKTWKHIDDVVDYGVEKFDGKNFDNLGLPHYTNAELTTDAAIKAIPNEDFIMYVHYWDTHWPWVNGKENIDKFMLEREDKQTEHMEIWKSKVTEQGMSAFEYSVPEWKDSDNFYYWKAWYDAEIEYMDKQMLRLINELPEDTLLIVTADHAESMGEHGAYFTHSQGGLYNEVIHVPLIVNYPKYNQRHTVHRNIETRHVYDIVNSWLEDPLRIEAYADEYVYSCCRKRSVPVWDSIINNEYKIIVKDFNMSKIYYNNLNIDPLEKEVRAIPEKKQAELMNAMSKHIMRWYTS